MRRRILIVDDEPGMLRAVRRILEDSYEVVGAASPDEALERIETFEPELAILDIRMRGMDGFQLMKRIQQRHPDVDVILMTGSVAESDQKLIRAIRQKAFYFIQKPFDREVLHTLVERCLELRRLNEENRRHTQRLEKQLEQARVFQRSLLPPPSLELDRLSLDARYLPSDELSGDLYDYATCGTGRIAFLVADVSGHGASAAMLTGVVKSAFHSCLHEGYAPAAVVRNVSSGIRGLMNNRFVTLFAGILDLEASTLDYVNAAHPPAILRGGGGKPRYLNPTGPIISPALPDCVWDQRRETFEAGQSLLLYTDGVTEAAGDEGEFGFKRLCEVTCDAGQDGAAMLDELVTDLERFTGGRRLIDDVTLMALRRL